MAATLCVFDAYGTLFDVSAAARAAAREPGRERLAELWPELSAIWRQRQLQYAFHRAITGDFNGFWRVTCDALDFAMESVGLGDDDELRERLRALYRDLDPYPEARAALETLKAAGVRTAILSNGSKDMLGAAIAAAGFGDLLDDALSVDDVGVFKPHVRVYDMVGARFPVADRAEVLFVSSNGWDAAAAGAYGFDVAWVNRDGAPAERLPDPPRRRIADLSAVPPIALAP